MMATFVLVPGWWLGGWAWDAVTRELTKAGHDVHPVTLPGLAERAGEATPHTDLDSYIADLRRLIEGRGLREVILVGHSGGNMPVAGVAAQVPDLVRRVVYVDTGPMPDGMSALDFYPPDAQQGMRAQVTEQGDGWLLPMRDWDAAADPVYLAGLTTEHLTLLGTAGTPQPFGPITQPLNRPGSRAVPGTVIATTFTPEQARQLAASGNPVFAEMSGLDVVHLPTGHWPMLSRPADLAALLDHQAAAA
ncbi:MAG TPA: alpha/beta fold hydrolase [Streptosporangiaceae bacterium]|nr:alpha/beta fold hydrolase [Streptosporangiaceae bacterium]